MASLCDPDADPDRIAKLLCTEPGLYARVLRVANSAFYGQTRSIKTVERAMVILGLDAVRGIAAAACLDRSLKRNDGEAAISMESVLRHSLSTAVAAQELARSIDPSLASEAFIGGLLHNLGIAIQVQLEPSGVVLMTRRRQLGDRRSIRSLESECVSIGHEDCIAVVFQSWRLPESLIAAVANHHHPMNAPKPHRRLATILSLAATIALERGSTFSLEVNPASRDSRAMTTLNVSDELLNAVAHALPERAATLIQAVLHA